MRAAALRGLLRPPSASTGASQLRAGGRHASAAAAPAPRVYHYNISTHGLLFLAATQPQNITSALKDARFLDFFFARVRRVQRAGAELALAQQQGGDGQGAYAWVSGRGRDGAWTQCGSTRPAAASGDQSKRPQRSGTACNTLGHCRLGDICILTHSGAGLAVPGRAEHAARRRHAHRVPRARRRR
jgi:hypothetical protein